MWPIWVCDALAGHLSSPPLPAQTDPTNGCGFPRKVRMRGCPSRENHSGLV